MSTKGQVIILHYKVFDVTIYTEQLILTVSLFFCHSVVHLFECNRIAIIITKISIKIIKTKAYSTCQKIGKNKLLIFLSRFILNVTKMVGP